ncbi:MAG: ComF family protein [Clostridia bacterium]|nr:ComF family protein [Clostridia bacterium]
MRLIDFFFPPKCVSCGNTLKSAPKRIHEKGGDALCGECRAEWEKAKLEQCRFCRRPMMDCYCSSPLMRRKGNNVLIKLCAYAGEPKGTVKQIIFTLKRNADRRAELFAACQLHSPLSKYISKYLGEDLYITNVPRRFDAYSKYGYDHAEILARNLSRISGIPYLPLIERVREGKEQKNLTVEQRCENIKDAFALTKEAEKVQGKCIILIDDIVTTGASVNECISVLKRANPAAILPACIAQTTKTFKAEND